MIETDLHLLACPKCHSKLAFAHLQTDDFHAVREGLLVCLSCEARYAIMEYVLILLPGHELQHLLSPELLRLHQRILGQPATDSDVADKAALRSGVNWGQQFGQDFRVTLEALQGDGFWGKEAFWQYCGLSPEDVANKNICVFCGGSGREAYHLAAAQASRIIVIDIGQHLFNIPRLLPYVTPILLLVLTDYYFSPVKDNSADITICDHALQHIDDHARAYSKLCRTTMGGGLVSICVYSHENNFIMNYLVEPAKGTLHRFGNTGIRSLSHIPAIILYAMSTAYTVMQNALGLCTEHLPYAKLIALWRRDGYPKFHEACFDLIHAPISYHFKYREVHDLARNNGLTLKKLEMINSTMWTMVAQKPMHPTDQRLDQGLCPSRICRTTNE